MALSKDPVSANSDGVILMAKKAQIPRVGSYVKIKDKRYRWKIWQGVVTQSFADLLQIYGVDDDNVLDYHEIDEERKFLLIETIEKDKLRFVFDQAIREREAAKIKAEIKFNELNSWLIDEIAMRNKIFGSDTQIAGIEEQ